MKLLTIAFLLCSAALFGQNAIPAGTVLPAQLNSSLDSQKSKPGQVITARIMQDVPLPGGKIRAGAQVVGHVVSVTPASAAGSAAISLRFDAVRVSGHTIPVTTNLRALASMMEVEDAQVPSTGTDRGSPWAWMNTNQVGGEAVYGQGGAVTNGSRIVGESAPGGVLVRLSAKPGTSCRGEVAGNDRPQALWIFSSDACGLYGFSDLEIAHPGRTEPRGHIALTANQGRIHISGGSGVLLRVDEQ